MGMDLVNCQLFSKRFCIMSLNYHGNFRFKTGYQESHVCSAPNANLSF